MAGMRCLAFIIFCAISVGATLDSLKHSVNLGRIARGHPATVGQFPYTVRMYVDYGNYERMCGAALIGTSWLLTAAHCFNDAIAIGVHLGSVLIDDAEVSYNVPIDNIVLHPLFNKDGLFNDIALLKIPPTDLCDGIGIVPLPKIRHHYPTYEHEVAKGSGWGITNDQSALASNVLQWGRMKILTEGECRVAEITDDELCTARSSDWATTCPGDSGGPLVLEATGELIGIAFSGDKYSCEEGDPSVFVRVTSHLDWIKSVSGIFYQ